jgi:hypothetical protein
VARIDGATASRFAGIGNVGASVTTAIDAAQALVSHNGIVGHNMRKVQEFRLPCPPGALCILHSDGIQTQLGPGRLSGSAAARRHSWPRC